MSTTSPTAPTHVSRPGLEGRVLGRYRILTHIANGGMASVHVARAEGTFGFERLVALKLLHPHLADELEFVTMIADEARMAARIRHPKVVSVLDVDEDRELGLYLVMDYVDGDHLGNVLHALRSVGERMPARVVVRIVLDLLEALTAAHELVDGKGRTTPIIHRDVSPHNVLVGADGIARLADFGVAHAEARVTHTQEGRLKGKIAYMAPEQLADGRADARSDLFAVGIVLWETLNGRRLFRADSTAETLKRLLHDPIPRVDEFAPELAPFDTFVARALARDPAERFTSASKMARELAIVASASSGIAEPSEVGELVRATRGAMLGERAARVRANAEAMAVTSPSSPGSRVRTNHGTDAEVTRIAVSGASSSFSALGVHREDAVPARRSRVLRVPLAVGVLAMLVAFGAGLVPSPLGAGLGATISGSRAATRTGVASVPGPRPVLEDGGAMLLAHVDPGIASERGRVAPTIVVRVRIGTDGRVLSAAPFQPRPDRAEIERLAVATVRGYRFRSAVSGGRFVEGDMNVPVRFRRVDGPQHVVRIKGSDTIGAALAPALAIAFRMEHPEIDVLVEGLGSSTAFVGLFDGTTELGTSSRPADAAESERARQLGIYLEETVVAYDGIAVVVHHDSPIASLSMEQVARIFAGQITTFEELGGTGGPIHLVGRPSYSGTHGFFESRLLRRHSLAFSSAVRQIERSEDVVHAVAHDPAAIGYVGTAALDTTVRALALAEDGRSVAPSEATIRDGSYPVARPLLVYSRGAPSGAAATFLRFVLSPSGHAVVRAHGFVASESTLAEDSATTDAQGELAVETRRIEFPGVSTTPPPETSEAIAAIARYAAVHPSATLLVTGHADSEGDEERNVATGLARAEGVAEALHRLHVARSRIRVESRGSSAPIASNRDATGREQNRRVEVVFLDAAP